MTIDEAQRCPNLMLSIKAEVDRHRRNGMFILSGSAHFALLHSVSESLAGRAIYHELEPLSRRELRRATRLPPFLRTFFETGRLPAGWESRTDPILDDEILAGGLPPAALTTTATRTRWFEGFVQTYLERDLRNISQVADLADFQRLMRLAALRTGQVLVKSELARDAALPVVTAGRYLRLMETSYVLRTLSPYTTNRASRLIKAPKGYVSDAGLASHLAGIGDPRAMRRTPQRGALLETYAMQNMRAICSVHWRDARFLFWHVQGRHEVDLVVEDPRGCVAIEIKAAERWDRGDLAGLAAFLRRTPECRAGVLAYNGRCVEQVNPRLWVIPLGLLLS